jgi:hypothetical protein
MGEKEHACIIMNRSARALADGIERHRIIIINIPTKVRSQQSMVPVGTRIAFFLPLRQMMMDDGSSPHTPNVFPSARPGCSLAAHLL